MIRRLDEQTTNRIAAGEIIVRPVNAVKELLENSIDAQATEISIEADKGGFGSLVIKDNGVGMCLEDLVLCAQKHTTSKIEKFDDLDSLRTFGFRGEALSSISHISNLRISSRQKGKDFGNEVKYTDGVAVDIIKDQPFDVGTCVEYEDLFLSLYSRKKGLVIGTEYAKILELVQSYSLVYPFITLECRKKGKRVADFRTRRTSIELSLSLKECHFFGFSEDLQGATVQGFCRLMKHENVQSIKVESLPDEDCHFEAILVFENPSETVGFSKFKSNLIFFVNNRLVDCPALSKSINDQFSKKTDRPQVIVHLHLHPETIDVNLHPTKARIEFLWQSLIVNRICDELKVFLARLEAETIEMKPESLVSKAPTKGSHPTRVRTDHLQPTLFDDQKVQTHREIKDFRELEVTLPNHDYQHFSSSVYIGPSTRHVGFLQLGGQLLEVNFVSALSQLFKDEIETLASKSDWNVIQIPSFSLSGFENQNLDDLIASREEGFEPLFPLIMGDHQDINFIPLLEAYPQVTVHILTRFARRRLQEILLRVNEGSSPLDTYCDYLAEEMLADVIDQPQHLPLNYGVQKKIHSEFFHLNKEMSTPHGLREVASLDKLYRVFERC